MSASWLVVLAVVTLLSAVESDHREVHTQGEFVATYFPLKTTLIKFKVKTTKDANVILTRSTNPNLDVDPYFEIIIGGLDNKLSGIRNKRPHLFRGSNREKALLNTPNILNGQEFRGFWVQVEGKSILVGKEGEKKPFMEWTDPDPVDFPYYGVSSCCGASADWKIDDGPNNVELHDKSETMGPRRVHTKGEFVYDYAPLTVSYIKFRVKTSKDASIILTESTNPNLDVDPFYEIVIGGLNNVHSNIRTKRPHLFVGPNREKTIVDTFNILNPYEFRGFWLRLEGRSISVGKENQSYPFMQWTDIKPLGKSYYGVASCCGAEADWEIIEGETTSESPKPPKPHHNQGKKHYTIDEELKTWDEAKDICEKRGQRLASVRSPEEQKELEQAIQNSTNPFSGVWLAANDRSNRGEFVWHDGTNELVSYTHWEKDKEPFRDSSSFKNCVFASYVSLVVKKEAYWYLQECYEQWYFVCESYS